MTRALLAFFVAWLGLCAAAQAETRSGAIVLVRSAVLAPSAKSLARALYREAELRPVQDERTLRAVLGEPLADDAPPDKAELGRVARAAVDATDPAVAARLLRALGEELACTFLVVVEGAEPSEVARVFAVDEGRFLPLVISPRRGSPADGHPAAPDWSDAGLLLRGLVPGASVPAPEGPERARSVTAPSATLPRQASPSAPPLGPSVPPAEDAGKPARPFFSSPWFWGGLAAVVTAGVTVLVLSQTALKSPDTLLLEGRIAP